MRRRACPARRGRAPRVRRRCRELESTIEILKAATSFFARECDPLQLICQFIDEHQGTYGVVPICRALACAACRSPAQLYWAHCSAAPSKRALWDTTITEILAGFCRTQRRRKRPRRRACTASPKMWAHLQRQGIPMARRTVEPAHAAQRLARGDPRSPRAAHHRTGSGRDSGRRTWWAGSRRVSAPNLLLVAHSPTCR